MKKGTRIGLAGLVAAASAAGGFAALGAAVYDRVMVPGKRAPGWDEQDPALYREGRAWALRADGFRGASIQSMEGLRLWGAWLPAERETRRWVICVHGFRDDHASMGIFARHYHEAGWNVLMPDQRGFGSSEGSCTGWGYDERLDLVGWVSWVMRRDPKAEILLHGVSMGAATVLMATGGPLPRNVKAAIADGSFDNLEDEMRHAMAVHAFPGQQLGGLSFRLVFHALRKTTLRRAGFDLRKVSPLESVERSRTPTLFIHGTADDVVPPQMMGRLYQAAKCPKDYLWITGGKHAVEAAQDPGQYWGAADGFLARYIPENAEAVAVT